MSSEQYFLPKLRLREQYDTHEKEVPHKLIFILTERKCLQIFYLVKDLYLD
jgi:hypothetical protein